jgi:hypothetical protein
MTDVTLDGDMVQLKLDGFTERLDNIDDIIGALDKQVDERFDRVGKRLDTLDADHKKLYAHVNDKADENRLQIDHALKAITIHNERREIEDKQARKDAAAIFQNALTDLRGIVTNSLDISKQARDVAGESFEAVSRQQGQVDSIRSTVDRVETLQRDAEERYKLTTLAVQRNTESIQELVVGQAAIQEQLLPISALSSALLRFGGIAKKATKQGAKIGAGGTALSLLIKLVAAILGIAINSPL